MPMARGGCAISPLTIGFKHAEIVHIAIRNDMTILVHGMEASPNIPISTHRQGSEGLSECNECNGVAPGPLDPDQMWGSLSVDRESVMP